MRWSLTFPSTPRMTTRSSVTSRADRCRLSRPVIRHSTLRESCNDEPSWVPPPQPERVVAGDVRSLLSRCARISSGSFERGGRRLRIRTRDDPTGGPDDSVERDALCTDSSPIPPGRTGGLNHVGLILESDSECSAIVERVLASGGSVQKSGLREAGGISEAFAYVRDPDGYALELSTQAILYDRISQSP